MTLCNTFESILRGSADRQQQLDHDRIQLKILSYLHSQEVFPFGTRDLAAGETSTELGSNVCLPDHCFSAFDALYCALTKAKPIAPTFLNEKYPLFVTWNTRSSRPGRAPRLRGCIGSFEALPLWQGVAEYALISAFRDSRFRKIDKSELDSLECVISLLTNFEDADTYLDWIVGVHGIYITFSHPSSLPSASSSETPSPLSSSPYLPRVTSKQTFTATFLPDVIPEQGWDKIEADLRRSVKLRRYQSKVCTVSWDEYIQWRDTQTTGN
ncbi:alport syndrome [Lyophyllum atratum]|nr:alport syndrome [Lyophyllum atratum]